MASSRANKPSVTKETLFGKRESLGVSSRFAREDHTHGTPGDPNAKGVRLIDTDGTHYLVLLCGSNLSANRDLTFVSGDADRTITISGNPTLDDWFDQAVKTTSSPAFQALALGTDSGSDTGYITSTSHATKGKWFLNAAKTIVVDERFSSPRVGVGTAAPDDVLLHLYDSGTAIHKIQSGGAAACQSYYDNTAGTWSAGIGTTNRYVIRDEDALADRLEIDGSGNVAFQTATAAIQTSLTTGGSGVTAKHLMTTADNSWSFGVGTSGQWQVRDETGSKNIIRVDSGLPANMFRLYKSATGGQFNIGSANAEGAKCSIVGDGTTSATPTLYVKDSNKVVLLSVLDDGSIGIGTSTPTAKLDVQNGGAHFSHTTGNPVVRIASNANYAYLYCNSYYDGATKYSINGGAGAIKYGIGANAGDIIFDTAPSGAAGGAVTFSERMRIKQNGLIGLGVSGPTARLHLAAGTAAANTAPLKFTSGTLMSAPEALAVECLTDDLYFTITTGAARKKVVLDDGTDLVAGDIPYCTTNGRLASQTPVADGTYTVGIGAVTNGTITITHGIISAIQEASD